MWCGHKIAYISATFFGARDKQGAPYVNFYAEEYLPRVIANATCIDEIIIPCNVDDNHLDQYERMESIVERFRGLTDIPITLFRRENKHYSYGAWNAALREYCDDIDFAFLLEDDYVVCKYGFDAELLSRYYATQKDKDSVLFCASLFIRGSAIASSGDYNAPHAAISNGLVNVKLFRDNGNEFCLSPEHTMDGPFLQSTFLSSFSEKGLSIRNMASEYFMPFLQAESSLLYFGNSAGPVIFSPVQLVTGGLGSTAVSEAAIEDRRVAKHTFPAELHAEPMAGFSVLSGGAKSTDSDFDSSKGVLVLSAPRSGSSCLTACVSFQGFSTGRTPTTVKDKHNAKGYFENRNILDFNGRVLTKLMGKGAIFKGEELPPEARARLPEYRAELQDLLRREFTQKGAQTIPFVLKDPRIILLRDLYFPLLPDVRIICLSRSRVACVSSVARMAGSNLDQASEHYGKMWDNYERSLDELAGLFPSTHIRFEEFMAAPEYTLEELCDFLSVPLTAHGRESALEFIEIGLINHVDKWC